MTAETKNKFKKALLSWMCVAALASGAVPGGFSGIIPTMTAAAEEPVTYDAEIDLAQLEDYTTNNTFGDKVAVNKKYSDDMARPIGWHYRVDIKESGTYLLKGSNEINGAYVDVNIRIGDNVDADIICDGAYIKNVIVKEISGSGEAEGNTHNFVSVFQTTNTNSNLNLSGTLAIERTYCGSHDINTDYLGGNTSSITGTFFDVTYTDAAGNYLSKTAYLSGGTYEDKSGISANYACVTANGAAFDYNNITAAATVICSDHTSDANGKCTNCGEVYLVDLSKLVDYKNGTAECPYGLSFNTPEDFSDILEVTFTKSGTYKLTGSNLIGGAYLDVKFIIADGVDVTLDCDDAFLKNDKGVRVENEQCNVLNLPANEPVYSYDLVASGYFTLYNYVHPFSVGNNATVNFTGKLFVDTFSDENYVPMFDDYRDMPNNIYGIYYNLNGSSLGKKFFVSGTEYDLSDYAVDFHCIKKIENNSPGIYTFRDNWLNAYVYTHHAFADGSDTCTQCGKELTGIAVNKNPQKTSYYAGETFDPTGLELELTFSDGTTEKVTYSESNKSDFTFSVSDNLTTADTNVTVTYKTLTADFPITVTKKSTGGSSGGSTRPITPPEPDKPIIGGTEKSWSDVAKDIEKFPEGKTETISLNGNTTVPADVIKAIAETKAVITFRINSAFSWTVDGSTLKESDIKDYDFQIKLITASGTETLRGAVGTGFIIDSVTEKATLNINFKKTHAQKFANLYKMVDDKLVFVDNVKIDDNGAAVGLEVSEKGEYIVMLGNFSDRPGDMDNDGILNSKDALAIIKNYLEIEIGSNPFVADLNGDGYINAKDALIVLKKYLGIE